MDLVKLSMLIKIASVTTKKISIEHTSTREVTEKKWNKKTKSKRRQKKGRIRSKTKPKQEIEEINVNVSGFTININELMSVDKR